MYIFVVKFRFQPSSSRLKLFRTFTSEVLGYLRGIVSFKYSFVSDTEHLGHQELRV